MTRRQWLTIVLIGAAGGLALRLVLAGDKLASNADIIDYLVFGWDEKTVYATGFTEARFAAIRVGESEAVVVGRLGPPLRKVWMAGTESTVLYYSQGRVKDGSFWLRYVEVDKSGEVISMRRMFVSD